MHRRVLNAVLQSNANKVDLVKVNNMSLFKDLE
jgi:hypothetical protein